MKRSVAVIYPSIKMDSADKANFIGSITQTINAMSQTLKYAPNSGYVNVTSYWYSDIDQNLQEAELLEITVYGMKNRKVCVDKSKL